MMKNFFQSKLPPLTVILQCQKPEIALRRIEKALPLGADAFGLQVESLLPEYRNDETLLGLFAAMQGKPVYVTNYRKKANQGKDDETLARELLHLAELGATLCDVIGDFFAPEPHPDQLTEDPEAVKKQKELIDALHDRGAQALVSSHTFAFRSAERVVEMALSQEARGADVVKIVTRADSVEEQLENLRITALLKQNLRIPFLFLSGGRCDLHRRIGPNLGSCMYLCVYEHDEFSTSAQPLLSDLVPIRDHMVWEFPPKKETK